MNKSTAIALGVFAALLVIVLVTREDQVSVGIRKLQLPKVDKEKIVGVELSGAKSATLRKEGATWYVSDPAKAGSKYAADENLTKSLVDALGDVKATDFVTDKAEKLAELEIDEAKGQHVKVLGEGGVLLDVIWGKSAKQGGSYIRLAGKNEVFVSPSSAAYSVKRDVNAWRKKALFDAKIDDLNAVSIKYRDGAALELEKPEGATAWQLKAGTATPEGFRFDAQAGQRLAQTLVGLRAQEFLDHADAKKELLGFDGPHDVAEARTKDGKVLQVHLGADADPQAGTIASSLKTHFDAIDGAKTKDGKITREDLEAYVAAADAAKPADGVPNAKKVLEKPALFALFDVGAYQEGVKDDALAMSELEAAGKTAALVPARIEGAAQVYLVPQYSVGQLRKKLTDLRDFSLLAFDTEKAKKLVISAGTNKTVAEKGADGWKVVEPAALPAGFEFDPQQVVTQLNALKNTRAARLADPAPNDATSGLSKPVASAEVTLDDGTTHTLAFGKVVGDGKANELYVRGSVDKLVYVIGQYGKNRLEGGVNLFKKPAPPPQGFGGGGPGGIKGLEGLPPDVRRKLEAQLAGGGGPH